MPPLIALFNDYKIQTATAWMLRRPLIRHAKKFPDMAELEPFRSTASNKGLYKAMFPQKTRQYIMFEMFFTANLYDQYHPDGTYDSQISRLQRNNEAQSGETKSTTNTIHDELVACRSKQ